MNIAFIRQVGDLKFQLDKLVERANEEESQFRWTLSSAQSAVDMVYNTYHEVLERDNTEDESYNPPLKEIK
jgi:hypothetical protein